MLCCPFSVAYSCCAAACSCCPPLEEEMSCCIVLERVWSTSAAVLLGKKSCACLFIKKSLKELAFIDFL